MAPIGRLTRAADFERVLSARNRVQGAHFALHHVVGTPQPLRRPAAKAVQQKLSTEEPQTGRKPVDDQLKTAVEGVPAGGVGSGFAGLWLGAVVPKRHARRAVTRSMLKRQIRAAVLARRALLPAGLWIVRLRAGFDRTLFPSAASGALREVVRQELDGLLLRCSAKPPLPGCPPGSAPCAT